MQKELLLQYYPKKYHYLTEVKKIKYNENNLKTAYLIDLMHFFIYKYFIFEKSEFNMWSPLLRKKYGTHYNRYISWLIDHNIIQLKSKWFAGKKAITYKLILNLSNGQISRYKNVDKIILKKWNKHHTLEKQNIKDDSIYELRHKMIEDLYYVKLNYTKANNLLQNENEIGLLHQQSYIKNVMALDLIKNNQVYWNFDKFGRMHTNFTNLKKNLRNTCLTIDNSEIAELDIPNSQPFFLATLLLKNINIETAPEFNKFINAVKNNTFYSSFNDLNYSRKEIKEFVYKIFFGKDYKDKNSMFFKQKWPNIWKWIKKWKTDKKSHKALAWELQKLESDLIFNKICKEIKDTYPSARLFTVHDSIFFSKNMKSKIEPIFNKHLNQVLYSI